MSSNDILGWLASKPKLVHVLFVGLFVLTQVGTVVADNNGWGTGGP